VPDFTRFPAYPCNKLIHATRCALAEHLFPYARREQDRLAEFDAAAEVERALKLMALNEVEHAWVFKLAQRAPGGTGMVFGAPAAEGSGAEPALTA
jgi:hypothetical protein